MKLRKLFAALCAGTMVVGSMTMTAFAANAEAEGEFDPSGATTYHAYMFVQTGDNYAFRDPYNNDATGGISEYAGKDNITIVESGEVKEQFDGTFTDVEIKGNGTYTLTLEGANFGDAVKLNLLGISTDIPCAGAVEAVEEGAEDTSLLQFTDVTYMCNDSSILKFTYKNGIVDETSIDDESYVNVLGVNGWNDELCGDANAMLGGTDVWPAEGINKITVTFTVSGFDVDDPDAAGAEEETTVEETDAPAADDDSNTDNGDNNGVGKVTEAAKTDDAKSGFFPMPGIPIVAGVVAVIIIVCVVASSKKKN